MARAKRTGRREKTMETKQITPKEKAENIYPFVFSLCWGLLWGIILSISFTFIEGLLCGIIIFGGCYLLIKFINKKLRR